ncbi:MAG TPA: mannose-1-phosphate guanylyltransferase [Candidatus Binatia bacterium]|nr:mannose-1-phosphate guanylyltransferase [Candidatus Binatia bacterium]
MVVIIVAGGAGTRLWPLSTPAYPKHLLQVNGDSLSLLQRTYERAKKLTKDIYVVTEVSHAQHVKDQLKELPEHAFVIEPARRGTANCILAALSRIASRHDPDTPIITLWADHYIRDTKGFVYSFKTASKVSISEGRLVLVGAEPSYPATGFGYIQKGEPLRKESYVFNVHSFKEKPALKVAKQYVHSGEYLWNCGYFVGSLNIFTNSMKKYAPELYKNYQKLAATKPKDYEKTYLGLVSEAIDYALIEKVPDLLVVTASFDWMDLGSFNDLYKAVESNDSGNHIHGKHVETDEVENSFIQNYEDKPLAVIGLDNIVVVNTPHGMLVARKDLSQKVGEISKKFKVGG